MATVPQINCLCFKLWMNFALCLSVKVSQSGAVAQFSPCCCSDYQMFGCIIHSNGCFCVKIAALFVNGSPFTAPWTGRMAASEQNNNCFIKPAKSFQMVAEPQSLSQLWLFKPIKLSHFYIMLHHATWNSSETGATSSASWYVQCNNPSLSSEFYLTGSSGHYLEAHNNLNISDKCLWILYKCVTNMDLIWFKNCYFK